MTPFLPMQLGLTVVLLWTLKLAWSRSRSRLWTAGVSAALVLGLCLVWFPELAQLMADGLGVKRGVDAVIYLAIALLTLQVLRLHGLMEQQSQTIAQLVSRLAQEEFEEELTVESRSQTAPEQ